MSTLNNIMSWKALLLMLIIAMSFQTASAIPSGDLYFFRGAARHVVPFDEFYNSTTQRELTVFSYYNSSAYYYFIIRVNSGDAKPYDAFTVSYQCSDDPTPVTLLTTDYSSWVESGQISIKRAFPVNYTVYLSGELNTAIVKEASCRIVSATGLAVDNNAGYTSFNAEIVPMLTMTVVTLDAYCEDTSRADLIETIVAGILNVVLKNVDIVYTLFLIFEIMVVIGVLIGLPTLIIILVGWASHKITGKKLGSKSDNDEY